jgi:hypothetical protein
MSIASNEALFEDTVNAQSPFLGQFRHLFASCQAAKPSLLWGSAEE